MIRSTKLLVVLSALLMGLGLASVVASLTLGRPTYYAQARKFAEAFAPGTGKTYGELHENAARLHREVAEKRVREIAVTGGAAIAVGALFLAWSIDRVRLQARIRSLSK
ncbi:hypothetical protein HQ560_17690 [bacterium]|nr:hypothetical protein [bacterium]